MYEKNYKVHKACMRAWKIWYFFHNLATLFMWLPSFAIHEATRLQLNVKSNSAGFDVLLATDYHYTSKENPCIYAPHRDVGQKTRESWQMPRHVPILVSLLSCFATEPTRQQAERSQLDQLKK